jgi:hypothetical protein
MMIPLKSPTVEQAARNALDGRGDRLLNVEVKQWVVPIPGLFVVECVDVRGAVKVEGPLAPDVTGVCTAELRRVTGAGFMPDMVTQCVTEVKARREVLDCIRSAPNAYNLAECYRREGQR